MMRFDDKDLIAHYLRELAPGRASDLERALRTDPALAARYGAYVSMLRGFKEGAAAMVFNDEVLARNWKALKPSLAATRVSPWRSFRWRNPILLAAGPALAAAALLVATQPHGATNPGHTVTVRVPGKRALSTSESVERGDVAMGAQSGTPMLEKQRLAHKQGDAKRPALPFLSRSPRDIPGVVPEVLRPRVIASLPPSKTDAAVPHLIPFASGSMPAMAAVIPNSVEVTLTGLTQTGAPKVGLQSGHRHTGVPREHPADLLFAMGGTLIGTREVSGSGGTVHTLGATHAVSALAAFHQQLRPTVGYRIAFSYTRPDFLYSYRNATTNSGQRDINGRMYELSATYVVQGPHRGGLSTSAEAGGGLTAILPTVPTPDTSYNLRGAAVAGIAAEYAVTKHFNIHAGYRAQVFKGPDFQYSGTDKFIVGTTFVSNEPTLGITYRFLPK